MLLARNYVQVGLRIAAMCFSSLGFMDTGFVSGSVYLGEDVCVCGLADRWWRNSVLGMMNFCFLHRGRVSLFLCIFFWLVVSFFFKLFSGIGFLSLDSLFWRIFYRNFNKKKLKTMFNLVKILIILKLFV